MPSEQSGDGTEHDGVTTCPECDEPMYADEEWQITDRSLIGTEIGDEGIDGNYAHARCLQPDTGRSTTENSTRTQGGESA